MSELAAPKKRSLKAFVRRRNLILGAPFDDLDQIAIEVFMDESNPGWRDRVNTPEAFWRGVHKARTAMTGIPMQERIKSKRWLIARGSTSLDDGDVPA